MSFDTTIRTGTEESRAAETALQGKLKFEVWFVFRSVVENEGAHPPSPSFTLTTD